jgi:hypothetical protein
MRRISENDIRSPTNNSPQKARRRVPPIKTPGGQPVI